MDEFDQDYIKRDLKLITLACEAKNVRRYRKVETGWYFMNCDDPEIGVIMVPDHPLEQPEVVTCTLEDHLSESD